MSLLSITSVTAALCKHFVQFVYIQKKTICWLSTKVMKSFITIYRTKIDIWNDLLYFYMKLKIISRGILQKKKVGRISTFKKWSIIRKAKLRSNNSKNSKKQYYFVLKKIINQHKDTIKVNNGLKLCFNVWPLLNRIIMTSKGVTIRKIQFKYRTSTFK